MHYTYKTKGTCSTQIDFDVKDNKLYNVQYTGGCNGNLKAIATLVEGEDIDTVINKLKGITCNFRKTSCSDCSVTIDVKHFYIKKVNQVV